MASIFAPACRTRDSHTVSFIQNPAVGNHAYINVNVNVIEVVLDGSILVLKSILNKRKYQANNGSTIYSILFWILYHWTLCLTTQEVLVRHF